MKSDAEVQKYFRETAIFSFNGVLDDFVFGKGDEWYYLEVWMGLERQPEPYFGPFKTYDEAVSHSLTLGITDPDGNLWRNLLSFGKVKSKPTGYIYTQGF